MTSLDQTALEIEAKQTTMVLNDSEKLWCSGFKKSCRKTKEIIHDLQPLCLEKESQHILNLFWRKIDDMEKSASSECPDSLNGSH